MKRGLRRKAYVWGATLTLLMAMVGCGGGGGSAPPIDPPSNNPVPAVSNLSPSSATAGAAAQTLTINGSNFMSTSTVTYNNVGHTATLVSATKLTISLSASDQATAGKYAVVVTNPAPGGGSSTPMDFTVNNPAPTVSSLSPSSASAGAAAQTLTINGSNFVSASTVTYNNGAHTATLVSATKLTISLSESDQATAGKYAVVVTNPAPGGGSSTPVDFTVDAGVSVMITSPANPASVAVGRTLPITASVSGATADLAWTVNDVANGNSTYGTISGAYPNFTYTPPAAIPGGENPVTLVATQTGASAEASLTVTVDPSASQPTPIAVTGGSTGATGIDFDLSSSSSIILGLSDVGSCQGDTCSATVTGIEVSRSGAATSYCSSSTCTVWVLGQGLTNSAGTALAAGLAVSVTHGSTTDVTVSDLAASGPITTGTGTLTDITFHVQVSASAALGVRDLVVTLGDGQTQAYVGAIQIVD